MTRGDKMTNYTIEKRRELYLDWVNNFLTVAYFAEYYDISESEAQEVINSGRKIHERTVEFEAWWKGVAK